MKPSRLFTLTFFVLFFVSCHAFAQRNWWRYGVDEMVVIQVMEQPRIIDTLGQTFLLTETEYGGIRMNKMPIAESYYSKEGFDEFNQAFLNAMTKSGEMEVISHHADTIQSLPCLRFTFRRRSQNIEGQGLGVIVGNHAYGFQFIYSTEDSANATVEREHFFNHIEFNARAANANHTAKRYGYLFGMGLGFLALAVVPLVVVALLIVAVSYYRRKKRAA